MTPESPTLTDKARASLENDLIAWIVTIDERAAPHAVPVWFFWHDDRVHVFTEPDTEKARNIRAGRPALLHLNTGGAFGDDVVILHGEAHVSDQVAAEVMAPFADRYRAKYTDAISDYGMSLEDIAEKFSTVIVFTPRRIQSW